MDDKRPATAQPEFDRLIRSDEAAQIIGVSRTKMESLIRDGNISVVRIGHVRRIRSSEIRGFVDRLDGHAGDPR